MEQPPYRHSLTMNQPAVTGQAVSRRVLDHEGVFHCGPVTAKAVSLGNFPAFSGKFNRGRIVPEGFGDQIPQAGLGFVGKSNNPIRIGHVAFDAGEGAVLGTLPFPVDVAHAVAAGAELSRSRGVVSARRQTGKKDSRQDGGGKKEDRFFGIAHHRWIPFRTSRFLFP